MPNCTDIRDKMLDLLYGEIDGPAKSEAEAHLAACETCMKEWAELKGVRNAFSGLPSVAPSKAMNAYIMAEAAKAANEKQERFGVRFVNWFQSMGAYPGLAAAASLLLVCTVAGTMYLKNGADGMVAQPSLQSAPGGGADSESYAELKSGRQEKDSVGVVEAAAGDAPPSEELAVVKDKEAKLGRPVNIATKERNEKIRQKYQASESKRSGKRAKKVGAPKGSILKDLPSSSGTVANSFGTKNADSKAPSKFRSAVRQDGAMAGRELRQRANSDEDNYSEGLDDGLALEAGDPSLDSAELQAEETKGETAVETERRSGGATPGKTEPAPAPNQTKTSKASASLTVRFKAAEKQKNCAKMIELGQKIRKNDSEAYEKVVFRSKALAACTTKRKTKSAPTKK